MEHGRENVYSSCVYDNIHKILPCSLLPHAAALQLFYLKFKPQRQITGKEGKEMDQT